jgi:hypothetical protein
LFGYEQNLRCIRKAAQELSQLFGWRVWLRGFQAGIMKGHGVGMLVGDGFQMPGVFLLFHGEVINAYIHQNASDRPDYLKIADPGVTVQEPTPHA